MRTSSRWTAAATTLTAAALQTVLDEIDHGHLHATCAQRAQLVDSLDTVKSLSNTSPDVGAVGPEQLRGGRQVPAAMWRRRREAGPAIRRWAASQGICVHARGPIPADVIERYEQRDP